MTDTAVAVFTRDLRLRDNPVLAAAARADRVVPLFVVDQAMAATMHRCQARQGFLGQSLQSLDRSLVERGGRLVVRTGPWVDEILTVAREAGASQIHVGRDVSAYARSRLARLQRDAAGVGVQIQVHDSITAVPPDAFGKPYLVFTPYWRRWQGVGLVPAPALPDRLEVPADLGSEPLPDVRPPAPWVGGEEAGTQRLAQWARTGLAGYDTGRDDPGGDVTSRISPYLHFGCLSAAEVAGRLAQREGGEPFVRQLCWRDFFAQLLWWRPETSRQDFRPAGAAAWVDDPDGLEAWKEGRTGYPLVDAGMHQLVAEGWMHNRVRMVTASFLTKDLGIDWRLGAAHFMAHLVDGDVASNQLSWQWVAGTGTDTNPWRVLNPTVQARRFDPHGVYVDRWLPPGVERPPPMVDHDEAIGAWRARRAAAK